MWTADPIPAFADNYLWLLSGRERDSAVVDPGDATPILKALKERNLNCSAILITHHHADHIGGVGEILQHFPNAEVYAPHDTRINHATRRVREGDTINLEFLPASFKVIEVPGHTSSHIAYYTSKTNKRLFCGDTLFACGCGRLFEGSSEQMHHSLSKIKALPKDTEVYCAHEYTLDNIAFAKWVEPNNLTLLEREASTQLLREQGLPSVPSLLSLECKTNPFLRFDQATVTDAASKYAGKLLKSEAEVFSWVRHWKDTEFD